jgi:hypothetical protein
MSTSANVNPLSERMKISLHPRRLGKFSRRQVSFYLKYASFVFKALRRSSFLSFLRWMLSKENIAQHTVGDVQVRVFPLRRENGHGLAGSCNVNKGKIRIYPKPLEFYRRLVRRFGKDKFASYARNRARAALIHELLHLKYASDEVRVRELTEEYFAVFAKSYRREKSDMLSISRMIFRPKTIKNGCSGENHVCETCPPVVFN